MTERLGQTFSTGRKPDEQLAVNPPTHPHPPLAPLPDLDAITPSDRSGLAFAGSASFSSSWTSCGNPLRLPKGILTEGHNRPKTDRQTNRQTSFQVYLLQVFGPVRRLGHGHEATVGQDGAHDEQTE